MGERWRLYLSALGGATIALAASILQRAWADGVPATDTLTYAGNVSLNDAPLNGKYALQLALWASETSGSSPLCEVRSKVYDVQAGRFVMQLPEQCVAVIRTHSDVWSELTVDGKPLGRARVHAVPYAIEAAHAVSSDRTERDFEVGSDLRVGGSVQVAGDLDARGALIRRIAHADGTGPQHHSETAEAIPGRVLKFRKTRDDTAIRVAYIDNFRTRELKGRTCRWELLFDGASCATPRRLAFDGHSEANAVNVHYPASVFGTCMGLAAGEHEVRVQVGPVDGNLQAECWTGWADQYWALEAEEVY